MERKFNHDDFEQFLKDSAEAFRMRPSPAVWKALSHKIDRRRRRITGFFILMFALLTSGYFVWRTANTAPADFATQTQPVTSTATAAPAPQNNPVKIPATTAFPKQENPKPASQISVPAFNTSIPSAAALQPAADHVAIAMAPIAVTDNDMPATALLPPTIAAPVDLLEAAKTERSAGLKNEQALSATEEAPAPAIAAAQQRRNRRLQWHLFAAPTVSYRKLSDNKGYQRPILTTGIPVNVSALYGINNAVTHKPDLGLELGITAKYQLNRNLMLRTGFQFNISRYDIKAFSYVPEVATIALNNGFWIDSVRAISNYRNFNGGRTNWLQNFYFQASVPVGMELKVLGNNKTYAGVASSLQPTYVIGNRAYMITADYKNYARVPWLIRRWNVNTSFEAFVTHRTRRTEWQVGPQVRYQILSSFINEYPVKENLFDFGLKVGVRLR